MGLSGRIVQSVVQQDKLGGYARQRHIDVEVMTLSGPGPRRLAISASLNVCASRRRPRTDRLWYW